MGHWPEDSADPDQVGEPLGSEPGLATALRPPTPPQTGAQVDAFFQAYFDKDTSLHELDMKHGEDEEMTNEDADPLADGGKFFCPDDDDDDDDAVDDEPKIKHKDLSAEMQALVDKYPDMLAEAVEDDEVMHNIKSLQREVGFPSYATFMRARHDPQFSDVKRREKHFHCRCPTCTDLKDKLFHANRSKEARQIYDKALKAHHFEVKNWRKLERQMQVGARTNPDELTLLSYDDTSAMGFPRITNRSIKCFPKDKVYLTPFNLTNHGTGENLYIYHLTHKWQKTADRLCTLLYSVISRIKTKPDHLCSEAERAQKRSRKLVLMGDNCSENKNNTLFALCTELIARKWYDEVEILFGPVGHTHNGNDAVHFIHNQIAGNFVSITPAELFHNYCHAWHSEATRPQPIIMETQFAWKERYARMLNRVSGFTNHGLDKNIVRAFRFSRNADNAIHMQMKGSPSWPKWQGQGALVDGPGFQILRGIPPGYPLPMKPQPFKIKPEYLRRLDHPAIKQYAANNQRGVMHQNLMEMARKMIIPSLGPLSAADIAALPLPRQKAMVGYGVIETIGELTCSTYVLPFLRENCSLQTEEAFWLNEEVRADIASSAAVTVAAAALGPATPMIRYHTPPTPRTVKRKNKAATTPPKKKPKPKTKEVLADTTTSESEFVPSDTDEDESGDADAREVPEAWNCLVADAAVGKFALVETQYGRSQRGISLCQVCVFIFLAVCLSFFFVSTFSPCLVNLCWG
jgi:hypothetical protein